MDNKCANTVCDNTRPIRRDPLGQWCDSCYPLRVDKQNQKEREIKIEQEFFNKHWRIADQDFFTSQEGHLVLDVIKEKPYGFSEKK